MRTDEYWMQKAMELADQAKALGEVPVGAVLVKNDEMIAEGWNTPIMDHDPTAHAEIMALKAAGKVLENYRLVDTTLYVTLEPCVMCWSYGACPNRAIGIGAYDPKTGAAGSVLSLLEEGVHNHTIQVEGGVLEKECSEQLRNFFAKERRKAKKQKPPIQAE